MAEIGKQLLLPEYGWKRVDSADTNIKSSMAAKIDGNSYGGSHYYLNNKDDNVRFNFTGTKFRLICLNQAGTAQGTASQGGEATVTLDGVAVGNFITQQSDPEAPIVYKTLHYEQTGLADTEHSLVISNPSGGHYIWFDAVDIGAYDSVRAYDETHAEYKYYESLRRMVKRNNRPGDKFACTYIYTGTGIGKFGPVELTESSGALDSNADGSKTQHFNFIFVGYAPDGSLKFIVDRNLQSTTWETLNSAGYCTMYGVNSAFDQYSPRIRYRLLHSAVAAGESGEWDAILAEGNFNKATDAASFWNTSDPSWTLNVALDAAANRVIRGGEAVDTLGSLASTGSSGFRPVLQINPVAEIVHRPDAETVCPLPLVSNVKEILPGQAISCEYTAGANAFGKFARLGRTQKPLMSDLAPERPDGSFHFICVGYTPGGAKKLVADRNIQGRISWETLNGAGLATTSGMALNIDGIDGLSMRLPGSLADRHVDAEKHGEWDAILSYRDFEGTIAPSDNAVWNCLNTQSWTLAVPSTVDDAGTPADPVLRIARGGQDKDHLVLRQCKYASSAVNERVGFRPVLIVKNDSRFLYLKESDNSCYALRGNGDTALLEKVVGKWAALSDGEKRDAFLAHGMCMLTQPEKLRALGKLRVLAYSLSPAGKAAAGFSAVPKDQLVKQKDLISLDAFKRLDKVALTAALQDEGICRVLVTLDHKAYLTFDFERRMWQAIALSDLEVVRTRGIAAERLQDIDAAAWQALTKGKSGLGFAYLVALEKTTDRCNLDRLALTVDVKGAWEKL